MVSIEERLKEKGWSDEEIKQAVSVMYGDTDKDKKAVYRTGINPALYWIGLIIAIIGNLLIAVVMIPLILVLDAVVTYVIIALIGLGFGGMFYFLLNDLEHVNPEHHVVGGIFIPAIALITIYVMVDTVNYLSMTIGINNFQNPFIISGVYVVSFTLPYAYGKISEKIKEKKLGSMAVKS